MKKGKLFVCSGPSGVGKGTLITRILKNDNLNLNLSISATTREKRDGEVDKKDYFFITKEKFVDYIKNHKLLEHSDHFENYYGTPVDFVDKQLDKGNNVLLEIEVHGADQVFAKRRDAIFIFLVPPSLKELEKRIRERGTESEEKIQMRLTRAAMEMADEDKYDYVIENDDLDKAEEEFIKIINKESN
jgi:guanylate kinase